MSESERSDAGHRDQLLLEEYRATVDLSKHDDALRQQRVGNFLTVNTVLLAVAGLGLSTEPPDAIATAMVGAFSAFGVAVAVVWASVQWRNSEYIRLRRMQLRYLERELGVVTGFTRVHEALNAHETVDFGPGVGRFQVRRWGRSSSTRAENALPALVLVFWVVVCVALEIAIALD